MNDQQCNKIDSACGLATCLREVSLDMLPEQQNWIPNILLIADSSYFVLCAGNIMAQLQCRICTNVIRTLMLSAKLCNYHVNCCRADHQQPSRWRAVNAKTSFVRAISAATPRPVSTQAWAGLMGTDDIRRWFWKWHCKMNLKSLGEHQGRSERCGSTRGCAWFGDALQNRLTEVLHFDRHGVRAADLAVFHNFPPFSGPDRSRFRLANAEMWHRVPEHTAFLCTRMWYLRFGKYSHV